MRKLALVLVVLVALFVMVGCKGEEPTPTPVEIDLDVQEIKDVLLAHDYELLIIHERREVDGGYEYGVKQEGQTYYVSANNVWLFSEEYLLTGSQALFIKIDATNYVLVGTSGR